MKNTMTIRVERKDDGWYVACDVPGDTYLYSWGPYTTPEEATLWTEKMVEVVKESMGPLIKEISSGPVLDPSDSDAKAQSPETT